MEVFLIYLLVMIESIASIFNSGLVVAIGVGSFSVLLVMLVVCLIQMDKEGHTWEDTWLNPHVRQARKWLIGFIVVSFLSTSFAKLLPTQKDLAIIVAATTTYQMATSEAGQRIGGKALDLLEKKIEKAIEETDVGEQIGKSVGKVVDTGTKDK